ncbi:MAG TPA: hypothetical protein VJN71_10605 [Nitrososphaerales archaeon]|nr:hypothetical protein [Nitrososphaerales archaeon]
MGIFSDSRDDGVKGRISEAIKQVDIQRKELEHIRFRLEDRRTSIFKETVSAIENSDEMRAKVLTGEHVELQKIARVVSSSELALLHIVVRLETIRDVGDVMFVLSNAFKAVKRIGKSVSEVAPNLESMASEINNSFAGILSELGVLTPNVRISLTDTPQEIFRKAQDLIDERTKELAEMPKSIEGTENQIGESLVERTRRIALLATEDDDPEEDAEFRPILLGNNASARMDAKSAVANYLRERNGEKFDLASCSAQLNLPVDLVEQAYIKLLSEGRFTATLPETGIRESKPRKEGRA